MQNIFKIAQLLMIEMEICAGLVKEFDVPARLLEQHGSLFAALVREYSDRSESSNQ
jgi:hypothetical protein